MEIGVSVFPTAKTINIVTLAREAEERGFESLWIPEHTHIPAHRDPTTRAGGVLAQHYAESLDPFIALSAAAAVTTSLRLGFGILLVAQRHPITTAKALASLDFVSNGRVMCGVGAGWIREEVANHGLNPDDRYKIMTDHVAAMKAIWENPEASFEGAFVSFNSIWQWPKPVQAPFPLLFAGNTSHSMRRAVDNDAGWFPVGIDWDGRADLLEKIEKFRAMCESRGRSRLPVVVYSPEPATQALDKLREGGVDRVVLPLNQESPALALRDLARFEEFVGAFD